MLFPRTSKISVFSLWSVILHGCRINFLISMFFYFSEKHNPNDNIFSAESASTGRNRKDLAMRSENHWYKGVVLELNMRKLIKIPLGIFFNGNTLINGISPTLV